MANQEVDHPAFRVECDDIGEVITIVIECKAKNKQLIIEAVDGGLKIREGNENNTLVFSDPLYIQRYEKGYDRGYYDCEEEEFEILEKYRKDCTQLQSQLESAQGEIKKLKERYQKLLDFLQVIIFQLPLFKS